MNRFIKGFLIVIGALVIVGALILLRNHLFSKSLQPVLPVLETANINQLTQKIKLDSLYTVKDVLYRDSAILVAVENPEKSGTEGYFDRKYKLNGYGNINMVYIYQYDTTLSLQSVAFDDALMATGKKMGRFQQEWVKQFIDTADGSCIPLRKILRATAKDPASFKNEETVYQPASIHNMQVVCKYYIRDSLGNSGLHVVTAVVDKTGTVNLAQPATK